MRTGFTWASLKGGDQWENVAINRRKTLKCFCSMMGYIGLFHLAEYKQVTSCKHGNETADMVKTLGISFYDPVSFSRRTAHGLRYLVF